MRTENETAGSQKAEIATIKERDMKLSLSDADVRRLWEMAAKAGMSAGELLESFVGDLVDGTYTNGSDERMCAQNWFERCWFSHLSQKTFLRYLVEFAEVDLFVSAWRSKEDLSAELADCKAPAEIDELKNEIDYWQGEVDDYFASCVDWYKGEPLGTLEEEAAKVLAWHDGLSAAVGDV